MNKSERKREDESTLISTMARVPLKSNFSINAILPDLNRDTPPEASPAPSPVSDVDDVNSDDGDVNVDYESDTEGKHQTSIFHVQFFQTKVIKNLKKLEKNGMDVNSCD